MSLIHRGEIFRTEQRLPVSASIMLIGIASAALWGIVIAILLTIWSMI
jgi:hypothetical protein